MGPDDEPTVHFVAQHHVFCNDKVAPICNSSELVESELLVNPCCSGHAVTNFLLFLVVYYMVSKSQTATRGQSWDATHFFLFCSATLLYRIDHSHAQPWFYIGTGVTGSSFSATPGTSALEDMNNWLLDMSLNRGHPLPFYQMQGLDTVNFGTPCIRQSFHS